MTASKTPPFQIAAAALGVVLILAIQIFLTPGGDLCDDALISARYARNWARGDGLTYNRDGQQPVEGYSNFLWVAVLAGGFKLGLEPQNTTAAVGMACGLAATVLCGLWVWRITRRKLAALAAMAALGLNLPFNIWAVQGLETPLIALLFLAVAATISNDRPRPLPWVFALLAAMTRPDGILAAAALMVVELRRPATQFVARPSWPCSKITGRMPVPLLWFALPFLAYTLWRWHHFGMLLPNTFGAKTGLGWVGVKAGAKYIGGYYGNILLPFGFLMSGYFYMTLKKSIHYPADFSMHLITAYLTFILLVGGDFMPDHRFLMHIKPLITSFAILIWPFWFIVPLLQNEGKWWQWLVKWYPIMILVTTLISSGTSYKIFNHEPQSFNHQWHRNQASWYGPPASWLKANAKRTDVIAAGDIGYIGYITDVDRILDFNGLVDRHLASLPGAAAFRTDADYVFGQRPDWLVLMVHEFPDGRELGHSAFDRAAFADPRLQKDYSLAAEKPGWSQDVPIPGSDPVPTTITFRIYQKLPY